MNPTTAAEPLMTADEFMRTHGGETCVELFRGRVVRYPLPGGPHGYTCGNVTAILHQFVRARGLGRVFTNDTFTRVRPGEVTDTPRGPGVALVSFDRWPVDKEIPQGPLPVAPDLVVEVRSPSDRFSQLSAKASEYLEAGVKVVLVLDPGTGSLAVHREDELPIRMHNGDELTVLDVLPGFTVQVRQFFE